MVTARSHLGALLITAPAGLSARRHHRARPGDVYQHHAAADHEVEPGDDEERRAPLWSFVIGRRLRGGIPLQVQNVLDFRRFFMLC